MFIKQTTVLLLSWYKKKKKKTNINCKNEIKILKDLF